MLVSSRWTTRATPIPSVFPERRVIVLGLRSAGAFRPAKTTASLDPPNPRPIPTSLGRRPRGKRLHIDRRVGSPRQKQIVSVTELPLSASPIIPPPDPPDICIEFAWGPHGIRIESKRDRQVDRTDNARQSRGSDAKPRSQDKARETHCPRIMGLAWTCTNLS